MYPVILGVLSVSGVPYFCTLELPWNNNEPNNSCIPKGEYTCVRFESERFGRTYYIRDVPNRSGILFHIGNFASDTKGCILLGKKFNPPAVLDSAVAMLEFLEMTEGHPQLNLIIQEINI